MTSTSPLLVRSATDVAADMSTGQAIRTIAWFKADSRHEEWKTLLFAVAARADLTGADVTRLVALDGHWSIPQRLPKILFANTAIAGLPEVQALAESPLYLPYLLAQPHRFAGQIFANISQVSAVNEKRWDHPLVGRARAALGPALIIETIETMAAAEGPATLRVLAGSALMDDLGWDLLTARLRADRRLMRPLLPVLFDRPDLTAARVMPILALAGSGPAKQWLYQTIVKNPACPREALLWLVRHPDDKPGKAVLMEGTCSAEVRLAAVQEGHLSGLPRLTTAIPAAVAHRVLDELAVPQQERRARSQTSEFETKEICARLASLCADTGVHERLLQHYLGLGPVGEMARAYLKASRSMMLGLTPDQEHVDWVLRGVAAHPDGRVRAAVVERMFDEASLASACRDSVAEVRLAAAEHPLLPAALIRVLAGDVSAVVRRVIVARADLPHDLLGSFLEDADEQVRQAAGQRFLTALTTPN